MKLNYKIKSKPSFSYSSIVNSGIKDSLLYLDKEGSTIKYEIEILNPRIDNSARIFKETNLKYKYKIEANTTDILITDVVLNGVGYYYELIDIDDKEIDTNLLKLYLDDFVAIGSKLYTNTKTVSLNIRDKYLIFSKRVYEEKDYNYKYFNNKIEITVTKKEKSKNLISKTNSDSCISCKYINDSKFELSSFIIEKDNVISNCIAGDIRLQSKKEIATLEKNFIKLKDKIVSTTYEGCIIQDNIIYTTESMLNVSEKLVEYVSERSSHIFSIVDTLSYFKIEKNKLTVSNKEDADFVVKKKIDINSIKIFLNKFLNKYNYTFTPNNHTFDFNSTLSDFNQKGFTEKTEIRNLSKLHESYYILNDHQAIKQSNTSINKIERVNFEEIEDYLDKDYDYNLENFELLYYTKVEGTLYRREK